jgi:hypothetical protein
MCVCVCVCVDLSVRYPLPFRILIKLEFSLQIFEKIFKGTFHENPPSGRGVVPCGRTDMTKLTVALLDLANVPKKGAEILPKFSNSATDRRAFRKK